MTITKESPRATGRGNSSNRYRDKNKNKKQWRLGYKLGDSRLDLIGNNIITPCVGHYYRGEESHLIAV
jgi:hypothetical protein